MKKRVLNKESELTRLTQSILKFRKERDWEQFHTPKDSAIALLSEATEVLDQFKWLNEKEMKKYIKEHKKEIGDELSDVLFWTLLMAHDLEVELISAFDKKMEENRKKYPIEKAKGRHTKYTKL